MCVCLPHLALFQAHPPSFHSTSASSSPGDDNERGEGVEGAHGQRKGAVAVIRSPPTPLTCFERMQPVLPSSTCPTSSSRKYITSCTQSFPMASILLTAPSFRLPFPSFENASPRSPLRYVGRRFKFRHLIETTERTPTLFLSLASLPFASTSAVSPQLSPKPRQASGFTP